MKKSVAFLLVFVILISSTAFTSFAQDTKLSDSIQEIITSGSCDKVDVIVYLSVDTKSIDEMPSFPEYQSSNEYAEYLREHNRALIQTIFAGVDADFINYALMGCIVAFGVDVSAIETIAENEYVRMIDIYSTDGYDGGFQYKDNKISPKLKAVLEYCDPESYVTIDVHNSLHIKTVAEMPSWPSGRGDREEMERQMNQARIEYKAYINEVEGNFFDQAFKDIDVVYYLTGLGFMTIVAVKAKDIEKIALSDAVKDIEFNENAFEILPEEIDMPQLGDADSDGSVTVLDATCIQKWKVSVIKEYQIDLYAADVDQDGSISILDATRIQK